MDVPAGATVPQDHLDPTDKTPVDGGDDELLADLPELKAPGRLRIGESNRIMKLMVRVRDLIPDDADQGEDGSASFDLKSLADEDFDKLLDMLDGVDKFAESIALDPAAYVAWSEGKGIEHQMALLNRYSSAVGESSSSAS
jgi:hypothetical protein